MKPVVLPASFSRSTLSNDILNILKQSGANSMPPSQPSLPSVPQPAPCSGGTASAVPSAVLENLLSSYDQKPSLTPESKSDMSDTPVLAPGPTDPGNQPSGCVDSQLVRPPANCDDSPQYAAASQDPDKSPNQNLTQVLASFAVPPEGTTSPEQTPRPDAQMTSSPAPCSAPPPPPTATIPSSAAGPFPGSTLLTIQPVKLPPQFNQELVKFLSDAVETSSSQELSKNASLGPCDLPTNLTLPPAKNFPLLSSGPLALQPSDPRFPSPDTVSQLLPATPCQPSRQLLNLLLNSPSTVQKLKSLLGYSSPSSNPTSAVTNNNPSWSPCQSSTPKSCLNLEFIKYLSTIPRILSRQ